MSLHLGRGAPLGALFLRQTCSRPRLTLLHYLKDVLISVDENSLDEAAAIRFDGAKPRRQNCGHDLVGIIHGLPPYLPGLKPTTGALCGARERRGGPLPIMASGSMPRRPWPS